MLWPPQYGQAGYCTKVSVTVGVGKMTFSTGTSSHAPVSSSLTLFPLDLNLLVC